MIIRTPRSLALATAALIAGGAALTLVPAGAAQAKAGPKGDFAVTVNGTTYNPAEGKDVKLKDLAVTGTIAVRGKHVGFDVNPSTLGVYNYTLTGAADPERMVTEPTVVFASKVPVLTPAQIGTVKIDRLDVKDDNATIILSAAGGTMKFQAKDFAQGGIFQQEPEFGSNVEIVHTLGPKLFYFTNEFTGKINFGDGKDPVTTAQSSTGYHEMLLGKDSPQVATKLYQDGSVTRWSVTSGGRLGGVLGEDAIELSQGATNCTSKCQAQNQIHGSLPVPPLPTDPTPLPVPAN
ncbi:hypothetical protein [Kineosporia sp. NBRC 101731]|uniref:hypothetical protein n=1 Tax=Kineosporia sp. NBRC 101731 TaxID=3032199 RepID=UPI0024A4527F|nr:hypothetical protein [Kineosporia sp. NBRC 101731]GLY33598.1 hypothetical protein Kisp02_69630 [Kineosporia sp. NBRC 101731]